jgi:hypothetical protein
VSEDEGRPAILVVTVEVTEDRVDELDRWYREEHVPEKLELPGYTLIRRFRSHDGSPKFLALYELTDPEVAFRPRTGPPEAAARLQEVMATWTHWERNVWVEVERRIPGDMAHDSGDRDTGSADGDGLVGSGSGSG